MSKAKLAGKTTTKPRRLRPGALAIEGAAHVLRTVFGDVPLVDAKADFMLLVQTKHIRGARGNERDPANCALAKACREQLGTALAMFLRTVAYLELPDANGKKRVVRYMLDDDAAAIVRAFDKGTSIKGEVMVTLKAPPKNRTLDAIRETSKRHWRKNRDAIIRGEIVGDFSHQARFFKKPKMADFDVRNGSGLVHNIVKKPKQKN